MPWAGDSAGNDYDDYESETDTTPSGDRGDYSGGGGPPDDPDPTGSTDSNNPTPETGGGEDFNPDAGPGSGTAGGGSTSPSASTPPTGGGGGGGGGTGSGDASTSPNSTDTQNQLTGGLEEKYGAMSGEEGALPSAVQQLQGRIDRNAPGVSLTDTNQYNITRRDGTLGVTFSADARQTMRRQTIQDVAENGPRQGRTEAPDPSTVEDPKDVLGVVAGPGGGQVAPAIQERRFEQQLAQELSASRADLKKRVASDVAGAEPSDVETRVEDGQIVASLSPEFGEGEQPAQGDRRAAVNRFGHQQLQARRERQDALGETAAAVTRFSNKQLQAQRTSTTVGGIDRTLARAQARKKAKESLQSQGLDPREFEISATATGDVRVDRREQFGDVPVDNPVGPGRLEDALRRAGDEMQAGVRGEFGRRVGDSGFDPLDAAGPLAPSNLFDAPVAVERDVLDVAEQTGLVADRNALPGVRGGEGPVERGTESFLGGASSALNPAFFATETKELGEALVTQPQRVVGTLADAGEAAADVEMRADGVPLSTAAPFAGSGRAAAAGESVANSDLSEDVVEAGSMAAESAVDAFSRDPLGASYGAAGGLAVGLATGTAVEKAVPFTSGSDLTGRALTGTARRLDASDFLSDTRGQLDFGGRSVDADSDDTTTITADDLADDTATADVDEPRITRAQGFDDVARDPDKAGLNQQGAFVGSNTYRSDDAFGGTGKPGGDSDFSDVEFRQLPRLTDDATEASTGPPQFGRGVGFAVGGLFGSGRALARETMQGSLFSPASGTGATATTDVEAGTFSDASAGVLTGQRQNVDADAVLDQRMGQQTDQASRVGVGQDSVFDQRFDFAQRLDQTARMDTRQDTRTDQRFDARYDSRADGRVDAPFDARIDRRTDPPLGDDRDDGDRRGSLPGWLTSEETFDTGVVQSFDELEESSDEPFGGFDDPFEGSSDPFENVGF